MSHVSIRFVSNHMLCLSCSSFIYGGPLWLYSCCVIQVCVCVCAGLRDPCMHVHYMVAGWVVEWTHKSLVRLVDIN